MMSMSDRLGIRIGFLIHDVARLRRSVFDSRNPHHTITRSESWVLTGVSRKRSGISQTELARVLGMGKAATGEFVKALERKGFVSRIPDPKDQRAYSVKLTREGKAILAKIAAIVTKMNAEIFRHFSARELQQFADHLRKMKLQMNCMVGVAPAPQVRDKPNRRIATGKSRVAIQQRRQR
jgi:DNA-binding MarR family transcriptional regulator